VRNRARRQFAYVVLEGVTRDDAVAVSYSYLARNVRVSTCSPTPDVRARPEPGSEAKLCRNFTHKTTVVSRRVASIQNRAGAKLRRESDDAALRPTRGPGRSDDGRVAIV
jgi:hypothetical protein